MITQAFDPDLLDAAMRARKAGINQNLIQQSLVQKQQQRATQNRLMQQVASPAKTAKPTSGKGSGNQSFLSSLISEVGDIGGAGIGGAIGTVLGGPLGGILGAGLGGFVGGAGGSAVEQKVRDRQVNVGDALRHGAINSVFSAGPINIARAGSGFIKGGATAASEALGKTVAKDAAVSAGKGITGTVNEGLDQILNNGGKLTRAGESLKGSARGVITGARVNGDRIGSARVKEINDFLTKTVKVKGLSAPAQQANLEKFIAKTGDELRGLLEKSGNNVLDQTKVGGIVANLSKSFDANIVGATDRQKQIFTDLVKRVQSAKSGIQLDDIRKLADQSINFTRSSGAVEPGAEQVFQLVRKELTSQVADLVPGSSKIKSTLKNAFDANDLLLSKSGQAGSGINPGGIRLPAKAVQAAQTAAGRGASAAGKVADATRGTGAVPSGLRALFANVVPSMETTPTADATASQGQVIDPMQMAAGQDQLAALFGGGMSSGAGGQVDPTTGMPADPTMQGQIVSDQQQTGQLTGADIANNLTPDVINALVGEIMRSSPDPMKDLNDLNDFVKIQTSLKKLTTPASGQELTADQQKKLTGIKNAEDQLTQVFQSAMPLISKNTTQSKATLSGAFNRNVGKLFNSDVKTFDNTVRSRGISIIRALGEVGNLSETEQAAAVENLPSLSDTPQGAQQKLNNLKQLFENARQSTLTFGGTTDSAGTDTSGGDVMNQLQLLLGGAGA